MKMTMNDIMALIAKEMQYGYDRFGKYHNSHEHYAVLQEEVDEWWDAVKRNTADCELYELIQVAAVALRYIIENCEGQDLAEVQRLRHES
jgi:NTP pyrophosphatase (non-canonical NTP hydrolase)